MRSGRSRGRHSIASERRFCSSKTAEILHAIRRSSRFERDFRLDHLVHRDGVEIDVQNMAADRRMLHFLHERETRRFSAFPGNLQLDENILTGGMTEERAHVAFRNLEQFGFGLRAIDNRRDGATRFDFSHGRSPDRRSPFRCEFNLCSHVEVLLSAVFDLEQRRNRLVPMYSLDAFTEKLGDAKHRGGKSFHGPHRRAVRGNQFLYFRVLQPRNRHIDQDGMRNTRVNLQRAMLFQDGSRGGKRAGRFGQIIDQENIAALDFADDIKRFGFRRAFPLLGDNGELAPEPANKRTPFSVRQHPAKRRRFFGSISAGDT